MKTLTIVYSNLLIISFLTLPFFGFSQNWAGNPFWLYSHTILGPPEQGVADYWAIEKVADTIIDDKQCVILRDWYIRHRPNGITASDGTNSEFPHILHYQNRVVSYYEQATRIFHTLYDFNLEAGDTLRSYDFSLKDYELSLIDSVGTTMVNGEEKRVQFVSQLTYVASRWESGVLIEDVGDLNYLYLTLGVVDPPPGGSLICYQNNENRYPSFEEDESDCSLSFITSIAEEPTKTFQLYPNPTKGELTISFTEVYKHVTIDLLSISGQRLQQDHIYNSSTISFSIEQGPGLYLLEITDDQGRKTVQKIMKD